eukprot:3940622-Amphidinium_carterae.1
MEHAFIGPALHSEQAARAELSCRVMWFPELLFGTETSIAGNQESTDEHRPKPHSPQILHTLSI